MSHPVFGKKKRCRTISFASNMWTRALTSCRRSRPTSCYRKVQEVYDAARAARGEAFELRVLWTG
jgi:hypothetical protein